MGRSTTCAVVPFKLSDTNWNNPELNNKIKELEKRLQYDSKGEPIDPVENGWKFLWDIASDYKDANKNNLYCDELVKDDYTLYVVNESEYAAGGDRAYCIFGLELKVIEQLCKDWNLKSVKISKNNTVCQTL